MEDLRTALAALAAANAAVKLANDKKAFAQAAVKAMIRPGERLHAWVGDYDIGTISRSEEKERPYVDSTRDLTKWAEDNDPSAFVRVLDPDWIMRVLASAEADGAALVYKDGERTGEVIPGIKFKPSGGTLICNASEAQWEAFQLAADEGKVSREGYVLTRGEGMA